LSYGFKCLLNESIPAHLKFQAMSSFMAREHNSLVFNGPANRSGSSVYKPPTVLQRSSLGINHLRETYWIQPHKAKIIKKVSKPVIYVIKNLHAQ